jgi:hypothetical protein
MTIAPSDFLGRRSILKGSGSAMSASITVDLNESTFEDTKIVSQYVPIAPDMWRVVCGSHSGFTRKW